MRYLYGMKFKIFRIFSVLFRMKFKKFRFFFSFFSMTVKNDYFSVQTVTSIFKQSNLNLN
jgi:hypothetical protein